MFQYNFPLNNQLQTKLVFILVFNVTFCKKGSLGSLLNKKIENSNGIQTVLREYRHNKAKHI